MTFQDQPKYGLISSIIASRGQSYWTLEGNGTIIRRDDDVPLNQVKRRMFDVNFHKTIYRTSCKHCGKIHKRRTTKKIRKIVFYSAKMSKELTCYIYEVGMQKRSSLKRKSS